MSCVFPSASNFRAPCQPGASSAPSAPIGNRLLQLRVFSVGLFVDRDDGIGVFPKDEEFGIAGIRSADAGTGIDHHGLKPNGIAVKFAGTTLYFAVALR